MIISSTYKNNSVNTSVGETNDKDGQRLNSHNLLAAQPAGHLNNIK